MCWQCVFALQEARVQGGFAVREQLVNLGLRVPALEEAISVLEGLPRFDDVNGAPLNDAAKTLLAHNAAPLSAGEVSQLRVSDLPPARIAPGTWKYVLLEADDAAGGTSMFVRNTVGLQYHAEMASEAIRTELHRLKHVRVLGGGRIQFSRMNRTISIWGYSKTYGRCEKCNRVAAELVGKSAEYAQYHTTWSNEGY